MVTMYEEPPFAKNERAMLTLKKEFTRVFVHSTERARSGDLIVDYDPCGYHKGFDQTPHRVWEHGPCVFLYHLQFFNDQEMVDEYDVLMQTNGNVLFLGLRAWKIAAKFEDAQEIDP